MAWFRDLRTSRFAQVLALTASAAGAQASLAAQGRPKVAISEIQDRDRPTLPKAPPPPPPAKAALPPFPFQDLLLARGGPATPADARQDPFYGTERVRLTELASRWAILHGRERDGKLPAGDLAELTELRSPPPGLGGGGRNPFGRYDRALLSSWLRLCELARARATQGQPGAEAFDKGHAAAYVSLKRYPNNPRLAYLLEAEARGTLTPVERMELPVYKQYPSRPDAAERAMQQLR